MRRFSTSLTALTLSLLLTSCSAQPATPDVEVPQETVPEVTEPEPQVPRETRNVFYTGVVRPAGISVYMEGSHKLELEEGRFVLLESDTVDLNGYVGENVEAFGSIRPTVEAGAMIMRVEKMRLMDSETKGEPADDDAGTTEEASSFAKASDDKEDAGEAEETSSVASAKEETEETEESSSSSETVTTTSSSAVESSSLESDSVSSSSSQAATTTHDAAFVARTETMAGHDTSIGNWTQKYCSSHIGFCSLVHKNWWFISFGATTSSLWHVEYSPEPIDDHRIGDGPIRIQLFSGGVEMKKAADKQVQESNGTVVGYREWTDGRHFEVTAPAALKDAVQLIVNTMEEYEE